MHTNFILFSLYYRKYSLRHVGFFAAFNTNVAVNSDVSGCPGFTLYTTGHPAASAEICVASGN